MDDLHADGAVAGFFCYPLDTLRGGGRQSENFRLPGQAGGNECNAHRRGMVRKCSLSPGVRGYRPLLVAMGLHRLGHQKALNMAKEFFEGTDIHGPSSTPSAVKPVLYPLKQQDAGSETENQDDELDERALTGMDYILLYPTGYFCGIDGRINDRISKPYRTKKTVCCDQWN